MNKIILIALAAFLVAGCLAKKPPPTASSIEVMPTKPAYSEDTKKILQEAGRLASLVSENTLTRVQAAQALDTYRIRLVGHNSVDDASFSTYLRNTIDRQNSKITPDESVARMEQNLKRLHARWNKMKNKPANPAFTNFLMQIFGLPSLAN